MLKSVIIIALAISVLYNSPAVAADDYRAKAIAFMSGNGGALSGSASKFTVHLIDLNGDGIPEALVVDNNQDSCGSHGCSANILDLTGPKARSMADLLGFDLKVLPTRTGGWRDVGLSSTKTTKLVHRGNMYVFAKSLFE